MPHRIFPFLVNVVKKLQFLAPGQAFDYILFNLRDPAQLFGSYLA